VITHGCNIRSTQPTIHPRPVHPDPTKKPTPLLAEMRSILWQTRGDGEADEHDPTTLYRYI
jgi:hypothetical protein